MDALETRQLSIFSAVNKWGRFCQILVKVQCVDADVFIPTTGANRIAGDGWWTRTADCAIISSVKRRHHRTSRSFALPSPTTYPLPQPLTYGFGQQEIEQTVAAALGTRGDALRSEDEYRIMVTIKSVKNSCCDNHPS